MGPTVYQRGQAAGELMGQRKLLVRLLAKRFSERVEPLVARTQLASESALVQASDLLAEKLTDDELLERLAKIFPAESEGK